MKSFFIFLFLLFVALYSFAQSPFGASKVNFSGKLHYVEMGGGGILSTMPYYNNIFEGNKKEMVWGQTLELAYRLQFSESSSFATRVSYRSLGVNFPENDNFQLKANYVNLYFPFEYDFKSSDRRKKSAPAFVVFGGPWLAQQIGGNIKSDKIEQVLTFNEIVPYDAGLELGVGLRVPIFSFTSRGYLAFKASVFHGALNTLPGNSLCTPDQQQDLFISDQGSRFNRGIRLSINYEMSLQSKKLTTFTAGGDGKKTYKRFIVP
jgi:hypothetical protein